MAILKTDPYIPAYVYEKQQHPDSTIVWRSYKKRIVDAVDWIVELAHGKRESITTESDWKILEEMFLFFAREWPEEYMEFKKSIPDIRKSRRAGGYSSTKEIKYVATIPPRFMRLVKVIFPKQQWDKKFVSKFIKRFPLTKIGGV